MNIKRFTELKEQMQSSKEFAEKILDGDAEYDGADGAREVRDLCEIIEELLNSFIPED